MWVVIVLDNPSSGLCGYFRRYLLMLRTNLFAGNVNKKILNDFIERIKESCSSAIVLIQSKKHDLGFELIKCHKADLSIVDLDGFQAIRRTIKTDR